MRTIFGIIVLGIVIIALASCSSNPVDHGSFEYGYVPVDVDNVVKANETRLTKN
jgi:hypothetical protein